MNKQINIFVASPSDVNVEREIAREVCEEFDDIVGEDIEIVPILWEYHPQVYHKDAQRNIHDELDRCDMLVVVLWNRLGTIIEGYEGAITKSKKVTGTQYEIERILANKKQSIHFYFKTKERSFTLEEVEEASYQKQLLDKFLEDINLTKGSTKHGYHEFEDADEFQDKLRQHLKPEIEKICGRKIKLPKKNPTDTINPNYFVGLYGFLAIIVVMIFLSTVQSNTFSHNIKTIFSLFSAIVLGIIAIAVKELPIHQQNYHESSFKKVFSTLLLRGLFMVGSAILLTAYMWFYAFPAIQELIQKLFTK